MVYCLISFIIILTIIYLSDSNGAISPYTKGEKWDRPFWDSGILISSDTFIPPPSILVSLKIVLAASAFPYSSKSSYLCVLYHSPSAPTSSLVFHYLHRALKSHFVELLLKWIIDISHGISSSYLPLTFLSFSS